ncbi:HAD-IIIA family hydrolase [Amycolatopsis dongchuanensis]|uniref:D,D-heptose 1,7-bisphosphate phosphatase n=1 Tax=Amycolatopsis dongchuanensis TaxID=1070866 RepID=A0ABP8VHA7_9PSEU
MRMTGAGYTVVVPTAGRASLRALLASLDSGTGPAPAEVLVVGTPTETPEISLPVRVLPGGTRNDGWRAANTAWVVFLDEDVRLPADWRERLTVDLTALPARVAASRGHLVVPPATGGRRPTEDERRDAEHAHGWSLADFACRHEVLAALGGFDDRLSAPGADFVERLRRAGFDVEHGARLALRPSRQRGFFASVLEQRVHADAALLRRKHGTPAAPLGRHLLATAAGFATAGLAVARKPEGAAAAGAAWLGLTVDSALRRILPGPRSRAEVARMAVTSALIPPAAVFSRLYGEISALREKPRTPRAILFDRDDTIIVNEPYLNDPKLVRPMPGAEQVLRRLREAGVPVGIVSNQSGIARGLITPGQLAEVNARVEELLGPFGTWQVCVHGEADGCACRKPKPGLVRQAARALGVRPRDCVVIGDIGADVEAARAAGATGILVPTSRTREEEVRSAPHVARDLVEAVGLAIGERSW